MKKQQKVTIAILLGIVSMPLTALAEDDSWIERMSFSGDFRLRYETIDVEGAEGVERWRYRARLALDVDVTDTVALVMQLATSADNPTSRNVTFDNGFSGDDIGFDLAYADWTVTDGLHLLAGKMKNPLFRAGGTALVWDGDLNPEGLALTYSRGVLFGTVGRFWVEERSTSSDSNLTGVQLGARFALNDDNTLAAGAGYYDYSNTVGNEPFYNGLPKGNTVDLSGNYVYEYRETELFAQWDTRIGDLPVGFHAIWVSNSEVDEQDSGFAYGFRIGAAKSKGQWEFGWTYQDIEADAVVGTFNDSDFGGGGTDTKGHIIKGRYAVAGAVALSATYFQNDINLFSPAGLPRADFDRLQLDVEFKFK